MSADLTEMLNDYNIDHDEIRWKFADNEHDEAFLEWFEKNIDKDYYDFVISINYWPLVAEMCHRYGYKYIAWCYDCPLNIEHEEQTMRYPGNYIFLFDSNQYQKYRDMGMDTVYHLPLGVNDKRVKKYTFDEKLRSKYETDISFVGQLYESDLPLIISGLDEDTVKVLNEMVGIQEKAYGQNIISQCVTSGLIDLMNSRYMKSVEKQENALQVSKKAVEWALFAEATRRNRLVLLNLFGRRYSTKLYSYQVFDKLEGVELCGRCNYYTEMPYVFHFSRINLNPVLRAIETGIPLRAFDIMGYGGLLLSSYQEELADMYEHGKDCLIYKSYEEALELADYYLKNDDKREKIALSGREKTLTENTLQKRFAEIAKIAEIE
jgi:spore maturation protein CgeB